MINNEKNKRIGNVRIDYSEYSGMDLYSDGDIEDTLLEVCENQKQKELLLNSNSWPVMYHISDIRENLLEWCPIFDTMDVLEIGAGCGGITGILSNKARSVTCIELSEKRSLINAYRNKKKENIDILLGNFQRIEPKLGQYDVITLIGVLEYSKMYINAEDPFGEMLKIVKKHLKEDGKLFIAIENKMGLKYWNGATEDHTGKMYSGLNDYVNQEKVRTFSYNEMDEMLQNVGFPQNTFYYPVPDYKLPTVIYSDTYKPTVGRVRTYKKVYSAPRFYNFMEDVVSDQLCHDDKYGYMSNSFFIISELKKHANKVCFAKYNRERREQFRIATHIVEENDKRIVEKVALNSASVEHVLNMKKKEEKWDGTFQNIKSVSGKIIDNKYVSEYIEGKCIDEILYEYRGNKKRFIENVRYYLETILTPTVDGLVPFFITDEFKKVFGNEYIENAMCTQVTNIDMLFSNIKIGEESVYAYDFEWVFEFPIPYRYVLWRAATEAYYQYFAYLKNLLTYEEYEYELSFSNEEIRVYSAMEKKFGYFVYGQGRKEEYLKRYQKDVIMQEIRFC